MILKVPCTAPFQNLLRTPARTLLSLSLLLVATTDAHAAPIIWDLQSVTFTGGAFASGYFIFDGDTQTFTNWRVSTSASGSLAGFLYAPTSSIAVANHGSCAVDFIAAESNSQFLCLNPASALIAGAAPQLLSNSFESYPGGMRWTASGSLQDPPPGGGDAVPEPSTVGLVALALAAVTGLSRRCLPPVRLS